ncbi:MAG: response regulator [Myxococcota bacterium]
MPRTLLLADDSVTIQKVVGISFANEDVRLVTVDNGDEAVARVREENPDLVLADVVMPGKSGYEVCETIKSDPALRHIPVLLLSGTFEAFDDERAQRAGADGHITKPFEAQTLVDRVNQLLIGTAGRPSSAEPEETGYDFFEETSENADPGETTVVASDDLEFGHDDGTFVFDSEEPGSPAPEEARTSPPTSEAPSAAPWDSQGELGSSHPDLAASAPDLETALDDEALSDLGLGGGDAGLEASEPPRLLTPPESSASDAVRALGLVGPTGADPLDPERERDVPTRVASSEFDVSSSDLGESLSGPISADPEPPSPAAAALRGPILEAVEKIAWEAFGDLADDLVKQTVAKVESVAWEVIPEMAERLIREEIRRLKEEE